MERRQIERQLGGSPSCRGSSPLVQSPCNLHAISMQISMQISRQEMRGSPEEMARSMGALAIRLQAAHT